ncbi:MAG: S1 family peptidase [Planctomycetota bacterium]
MRLPWFAVIGGFLLVAAMCSPPVARAGLPAETFHAVCRVTCGQAGAQSVGTGCVFALDDEAAWVLTCAHVVDREPICCEFWRAGHPSTPLSATLARRTDVRDADVAVLVVPRALFGNAPPEVITLAEPRSLRRGETVVSLGCPQGSWPTGWTGHVLGDDGPQTVIFLPTPADGRSGSPLLNAEGTEIVALVRARAPDNSYGYADSAAAIRRALYGSNSGLSRIEQESTEGSLPFRPLPGVTNTQCTPLGCFPSAPRFALPNYNDRRYVLPYRAEENREQQRQNPFPTLPQSAPNEPPATLPAPALAAPIVAPQVTIAPAAPQADVQPANDERRTLNVTWMLAAGLGGLVAAAVLVLRVER